MNVKENYWNDEVAEALIVQKRVLTLIGVWPTDAQKFFSLMRWYVAIAIQISTICSLTLEVYRHCLDSEDTMDAFLMGLSSVVSLSKLLILGLNWRYTYVLVKSVNEDWSVVKDARHRRIMTKNFKRGRFVSLMIIYLAYASGASFIFKALPIDGLLPQTNGTDTTTKYFLATNCVFGQQPIFSHTCVLVLQAAQIFVNATTHCGNDGFFFSLVMHLCGQFEVLKMNFREMEVEEIACRKKMKLLVRRHCRLAVLADTLEQSFNLVIFVQLLMSTLLLCVEGFQFLISLSVNDNVGALKHFILIVTMLVQLFLYAYAGDTLESSTEKLPFAVYDSQWYQFRAKVARDLILVINRGGTPHHVTAGKCLSMNLFTFKEILKASASYLSVLRVMIET